MTNKQQMLNRTTYVKVTELIKQIIWDNTLLFLHRKNFDVKITYKFFLSQQLTVL